MAVSGSVEEARRHTNAAQRAARAGVSALSNRVDQIRANPRLSAEGKGQDVAAALGQGGARVRRLAL